MKYNVNKFLSVCENDIENICKFLYSNPEESYKEKKSANFIIEVLEKYNFCVTPNLIDIPNSFYAQKGSGHPKICFLCEYDAIKDLGHITGHNGLSSISTLAALCLGNALDEVENGSVIVIGCPGEYLGGTKSIMLKQGVFDDIDAVLTAHPHTTTSESGSSSAIIPLSIKFQGENGLSFLNKTNYKSLDAMILVFTILNSISKGFSPDLEIHPILSNGGDTPLLVPSETEGKFYIRASSIDIAKEGEEKLKTIAKTVGYLMGMQPTFSLYEPPNEELVTNQTLNRLFTNNLKENGIINIEPGKSTRSSLGIGSISKCIPTIHSYISIVDDSTIDYGTERFAKATVEPFALNQYKIAGLSLALTGLDLILNKNLLAEAKTELYFHK